MTSFDYLQNGCKNCASDVPWLGNFWLALVLLCTVLQFISFKFLDNNEVKSLKNCETCVEPPSYSEVVIEDKKNLPTFEEIQHM